MKIDIFNILSTMFFVVMISCSDEGIVSNYVYDGEELEEGTLVYFQMEQNYPNPFNPSTSITYGVAKSIYLELEIFSEDWVKVAILINKVHEPGFYEITFNAEELASGEYYYTMTGDGVTQIMKMKLVK